MNLGGRVFFFLGMFKNQMHPWSIYGCKVTDWSTVTLPFSTFPPGVLAYDLEGALLFFVLFQGRDGLT